MNSFQSLDAVSKVESNLETIKDIGRVCLKVVFILYKWELKRLLNWKVDLSS